MPFLHCRARSFPLLVLMAPGLPLVPGAVFAFYLYFTRYKPMYPKSFLWAVLHAMVWFLLCLPIALALTAISQLSFSKASELVGDGAHNPQR